jgi:hypothetical protein
VSETQRLYVSPCVSRAVSNRTTASIPLYNFTLLNTYFSISKKTSICTTRLWLRLRIMIRASRLLGVPSTTSTSTNEIGKVPLDTITQRRLGPTSFPFVYKHTNDGIVAYRTVFSRYLGVSELEVRLKYHDDSVSDG